MISRFSFISMYGEIFIVQEDDYITNISFNKLDIGDYNFTELIKETIKQLKEYFIDNRTKFTIPIKPKCTSFQQKVYNELLKVPYGVTKSYFDLAKDIKNENSSRAIGNAMAHNPILFIIPCHRIVRKDKTLGGYAGGLYTKKSLLDMEENHAE